MLKLVKSSRLSLSKDKLPVWSVTIAVVGAVDDDDDDDASGTIVVSAAAAAAAAAVDKGCMDC